MSTTSAIDDRDLDIYDIYKTADLNDENALPLKMADLSLTNKKSADLFMKKRDQSSPEKLFSESKLIAHSVDDYPLSEIVEAEKVRLHFCSNLLKSLHGAGVRDLSATLLVQDQRIGTYRNNGILLDANEATIKLAAKGDANSNTSTTGELNIGSNNMTLAELTNFLQTTPYSQRPAMNEVKGYFSSNALVGLYYYKLSNTQLEEPLLIKMLLMQKEIEKTYNHVIPIFRYDPIKGSLERVEIDSQQRSSLYTSVKKTMSGNGRICANLIAKALGDPAPF